MNGKTSKFHICLTNTHHPALSWLLFLLKYFQVVVWHRLRPSVLSNDEWQLLQVRPSPASHCWPVTSQSVSQCNLNCISGTSGPHTIKNYWKLLRKKLANPLPFQNYHQPSNLLARVHIVLYKLSWNDCCVTLQKQTLFKWHLKCQTSRPNVPSF